ncbi:hypothetical protein [uncultured Algibacter sp.]|uniref:hypothetical protein n=1 Tax=uncultured Algibacter sp. TaxID=298659 RepID=UPI002617F549|nr:hypothetical protein [uncultured Algibacter sp.]
MRFFCLLYVAICLLACKAKKDANAVIAEHETLFECPENGACSFEIFENKSLQIITDEIQGTYPKIENGAHLVLKFEYKKVGNSNYEDSGYREEIFIELDKNNLEFETEDLQSQKLFFARWCYCKGQTGYYKINQGKLMITKIDDKNFQLQLNFKTEEVPQIITGITHNFSTQ